MKKPSRGRSQPQAASRKPSGPNKPDVLSTRRGLPPHITRIVAFGIIGISVIGGFVLTPLPVAVGITLLAGLRLWIWQREEKREQAEARGNSGDAIGRSARGV